MEPSYLMIYTAKGSHILRDVYEITKSHVTVNKL